MPAAFRTAPGHRLIGKDRRDGGERASEILLMDLEVVVMTREELNAGAEVPIHPNTGAESPINLTIRMEAPIRFADAERGVSATKPPVGQTPPVGKGAHSVPSEASSLAECAPEFRGTIPLSSSQHAKTARAGDPGSSPQHAKTARAGDPGSGIDLNQIVNRVLAANRVIERMSPPCPQGQDCAGDGKHTRIFECEEGCGFSGCVTCLMAHEAEPHVSDSDTAREMYGSP